MKCRVPCRAIGYLSDIACRQYIAGGPRQVGHRDLDHRPSGNSKKKIQRAVSLWWENGDSSRIVYRMISVAPSLEPPAHNKKGSTPAGVRAFGAGGSGIREGCDLHSLFLDRRSISFVPRALVSLHSSRIRPLDTTDSFPPHNTTPLCFLAQFLPSSAG